MVTGGMIGSVSTLRYREQAEILCPVAVALSNDVLGWQVEFGWENRIDPSNFRAVPVEGVMADFLALADGGAEQVPEFVCRRGVLGISPLVQCTQYDAETSRFTLSYREHADVYVRLARVAKSLLATLQALKNGRPISRSFFLDTTMGVREEERACWEKDRLQQGLPPTGTLTPQRAYTELLMKVKEWHSAADVRLALSGLSLTPLPDHGDIGSGFKNSTLAPAQNPEFLLNWGDWHDGQNWDAEKVGRFVAGRWCGGGERETPSAIPPSEGWSWDAVIPNQVQRPSALFNVLTFRLMQSFVLPKGTHWCIRPECGKPYTNEEKWVRMKEAVKQADRDGVEEPRNPRKDKGSFCSPECEREQKRRQYRESKRRNKKEPSATSPPAPD